MLVLVCSAFHGIQFRVFHSQHYTGAACSVEPYFAVTQRHSKSSRSVGRVHVCNCIISKLKRVIGRKSRFFTARRVCISRIMPWRDVSLFVCPSVTRRYYVETVKHVIKVFSPSGSQTILVFPYQTEWQYSDGDPSNGASNAKGV